MKKAAMTVDLLPGDLEYTGPKELDQYFIKNTELLSDRTPDKTVIFIKITFGRRLLSIILTIYFTTILLNLVGHLSVFFGDFYFEAQMSLNVTVILVQVTMFTSVSINIFNIFIRYCPLLTLAPEMILD